MPLFTSESKAFQTQDGYGFSGVGVDSLGATEYTLVQVVADVSGSVGGFRQGIEDCVKAVVEACRKSPRADNLMFRLVVFNGRLSEVHGFKPLDQCNPDDYNGVINPSGGTALFDASYNSIEATVKYGKALFDQDFDTNAIVFVITDGDDNSSTMGAAAVKQVTQAALATESLESLRSVLVGVNVSNQYIQQYLQQFKQDGGFDQYIELDNASASTLAKLADFISRSISSQSQALGTGGPSQSLTF
jgi:hypothetical protein